MDDRLKGLRKAMTNKRFHQLNFSDQLRNQIHEKIKKQSENNEDTYVAILQLLLTKKTGFDLTQLIRSRGIQSFEGSEGELYTLLHRLEQNGYLSSSWDESGAKYYLTTGKGKKLLQLVEKSEKQKTFSLKQLLEG